jgi:CheY-like chemotaxis protein
MAEQRAVLVVEDESLVRLDLATKLVDAGYLIFEASSAAEAIGILERHPEIRVVFTDIQMPGDMDGLALARYVRALAPDHHRGEFRQGSASAWRDAGRRIVPR